MVQPACWRFPCLQMPTTRQRHNSVNRKLYTCVTKLQLHDHQPIHLASDKACTPSSLCFQNPTSPTVSTAHPIAAVLLTSHVHPRLCSFLTTAQQALQPTQAPGLLSEHTQTDTHRPACIPQHTYNTLLQLQPLDWTWQATPTKHQSARSACIPCQA